MCGIFAIAGKTIDNTRTEDALKTLRQRGPDDQGSLAFQGCTLAQTRLSIVDLSERGHQPMADNTHPYAISFNGEVYGYKTVRTELERKGHRFSSDSDTETILKSYAEYGTACVERLDGMFAFALWDDKKKQLLFARDRFGKKPLYYAYDKTGALVIASEVKALIAYGITPEISKEGIDAYLTYMYLPPSMTVFSNVYTLPPAHYATYTQGTLKIIRYWTLNESPVNISYEEAEEETRRLLTEAVQKRMVADVEVGSFLSGGVDSTLVTAYAMREMGRPLKTFSLGYGEYLSELPYAKEAAEKIGTDHHELEARDDLMTRLEEALGYFDEPHGDSADIAQMILSKFTATKVKVALAGDGGDELFMGYGWYWARWNQSKLGALRDIFLDQFKQYQRSVTVFRKHERYTLYGGTYEPCNTPLPDLVTALKTPDAHKINAYDFSMYLPGQLLTKVDRMSMMHGLEVRCPLLDYKLAEFAYNLPLEYKMNHHNGKFILKDLLAEIMPRSFVDRKKQGFGAPVRKWLQEPTIRTYAEAQFKDGPLYQFLNRDAVQNFITSAFKSGHQKALYQVWVLLCLQIWLKKHYS